MPEPDYRHLRRLTDAGGLYEHALIRSARPEHGYCVDDVARGLVVLCRDDAAPSDLREQYLSFVLDAQAPGGFHNRRDIRLVWRDDPSVEDCWGRALWALGAASRRPELADRALPAFEAGAALRSPWSRANQFAALGAADVLSGRPDHSQARALLDEVARACVAPTDGWDWPEPRLTYANAVVPEVLLAAGALLARPDLQERGLELLGWLLDEQTNGVHLSVVPVGGRGPGEARGGFDQQPIEVAALADALVRAYALTGDERWRDGIAAAVAWFAGANDTGVPLVDLDSGGGCDGLEVGGRNENQGAESTLALLSTLQHGRGLVPSHA
jgi:hypothetical protein